MHYYNDYEFDQTELLKELSTNGIDITVQTLRAWTRQKLISIPGRRGIRSREAIYPLSELVECYAARELLKGFQLNNEVSLPRLTPELIAKVRYDVMTNPPQEIARLNPFIPPVDYQDKPDFDITADDDGKKQIMDKLLEIARLSYIQALMEGHKKIFKYE